MVKKSILAIVLIGTGCVIFFLVYEKDEKMSHEVLSEESSVIGARAHRPYDVRIYWTNRSGRIQRIRSDSSDIENLTTDVCSPIGIALDILGGQMYWTSGCKIQRANLDGSNVEELVPSSKGIKEGIALDIDGNKMYWTVWNATPNKIQRANLDGSDIEDIITDLKSPRGIALDVPNGKMYWADLGASKIQRANLNGSDVEDIITALLGPNGIALDLDGNKIYWADEFSGKIQSANLDGSNRKTLFVRYGKLIGTAINIPLDILGLKIYYANSPIGIALDTSGGKIYWTTPHKYKVQRANLDGSNIEDVATDSILTIGIALSTASQ
ncbi:MAG: SMP-30/gluconolactonase/LRE family protein [Candidatus Poribacteria bacterium]|nr:SMP-30/gluconolactonase/LRE family protein [Candidatus Poribacteria bacterium]